MAHSSPFTLPISICCCCYYGREYSLASHSLICRKIRGCQKKVKLAIWKKKRKIDPTKVFFAIQELELLLERGLQHPSSQLVLLDMRFLKMFFRSFAYWEESEDDIDLHFRSVVRSMGNKLRQAAKRVHPGVTTNSLQIISYLRQRIKKLKQHAREIFIVLLGEGVHKCKPCPLDEMLFREYARETASFIDFVLQNLNSLNSQIHLIAPIKEKIEFISGKLKVFGKFAKPGITHGITRVKNLSELMSQTRTWANHISCLACLYWIDGMDESRASTMGTMLFDLMHKTMPPYTPGVVASYFEDTLIPQLLAGYIDFFLEDLVIPMKDDIDILREGMILLLSFIVDPPEEDSEDRELIFGQIYAIINDLPSHACSIHYDEIKEGNSETIITDFLQKIARVKAKIRELYAVTPHSSQLNAPKINVIGFLDSLLRKLKKMLDAKVNFIASVKHGIQTVWEELASLRSFLKNDMELQNQLEELKALHTQAVNMVYYAACITSLCPAQSFSVWYGIICLPSVIEKIKLIKIEVKDIKDVQMDKILNVKMESSKNGLRSQATTSKIEGAFVGFEEEVRSIIDDLIRGQRHLSIVSISGMPGQGKTTLARRIYNDPSIQFHFHKMVWCYVSKECKIRDLIIHIVHDVRMVNVEDISQLEIQDLVERLWKSLKGKRYLIVMDDIWDVDVWQQVQRSFPNDNNGSRILFTSRNHDLASQANSNSISHRLRLLSEEESWDLMKKKVFGHEDCPTEFLDIGKQIATYCKGLPLAAALIAALLGKTERKLHLWNQVAENLKSHLASEGCMHIIELSYKYLPDHLKSCFLYLGAFPRGENIRAERLKLLWIGEGFIEENEMRSSKYLAKEYLDNLVSQNLVVVTERSCLGEIKRCSAHDLLYDLCIKEIEEENFLCWVGYTTISSGCLCKYNHHRICIGQTDPVIKQRPLYNGMELPISQVHSLLFFGHGEFLRSWVLKSFKVLTVLDLENAGLKFSSFPEDILSNIHLRYLAFNGSFHCIPQAIADLWNLDTLIVRERGFGQEISLPETMWTMESLKHVDIHDCHLYFEKFEENNNSYVALHNIETLGGPIVLPDDPQTVEFLKRLSRLRKLDCYCEPEEWPPTWLSTLGYLKNLEDLKIQTLYHKSTGLPTFNFPQSLKKLSLECLSLPWSAMSTIGKQLPNLEVLKLVHNACWGSSWDLEDMEFSKLRYLKLRNLDIKEINVSVVGCDICFPCLEELRVEYCKRLVEIPCSFGDICTLNTIKVSGCCSQVSESARQILEQQREMGNHSLQVFVTKY